jgi:ribosomal protein S18 acetylase RimI-like enzyme
VRNDLQIIDFTPSHADAFLQLNLEWLEKYFWVESIDRTVLSAPQTEIIDKGGFILFAMADEDVVGTVALKSFGAGTFELTKMAVTAARQGKGAGRALLNAAIDRFNAVMGEKLYLETHSSLTAAIALYESAGFAHSKPPRPSEYARADTYMVYQPQLKPLKNK